MDLKIFLISIFMTSTIYFAFKAHKYKTICKVMKMCFKKRYGYEITVDDLREMAKEELRSRFEK